jgi:hypothetical protein
LIFSAYDGAPLLATNTTAHTHSGFNFNFNTDLVEFFLGGSSNSDFGQNWNYQGAGFGFVAGGTLSALSLQSGATLNSFLGAVDNPVPLTAESISVPEPATLALLGFVFCGTWLRTAQNKGVNRFTRH